MRKIKGFLSMFIAIMLVFSLSSSVYAQLPETIFANFSDEEIVTFDDGTMYRFVYETDEYGTTTVTSYDMDGHLVDIATYNSLTNELLLNGELYSAAKSTCDREGVFRASNWHATDTYIQNFDIAGKSVATVASLIAAFTEGKVSAIASMISDAFDNLSCLSAKRTTYLNYIDYSPKVGGYYYSTIYTEKNAKGTVLGTVKSPTFIR